MFRAHCVTIKNTLSPISNHEYRELTGPAPLRFLAPETSQPFIILRNGEAVLRADWDQEVKDGDIVSIVLNPQGGGDGGSDVERIILYIIIAIISFETGGAVGAAYGSGWGAAASAAVNIVGAVLVNAILPPPTAASASGSADYKTASPTYNLSAQGNQARLESAIPIQYGRMISYPDFAASPYVEYAGNEQYLYQLFCLGVGEYEIEQIRVEDTDIESFEEVEYEVVQPYGNLTLFPAAVSTSGEVSGQELLKDDVVGPFVANPSGTTTNYLSFDVVCPRGLFVANDKGALLNKSITVKFEAREVDDYGAAVGDWVVLATKTITAATATPQRFSYRFPVSTSRYEVRTTRLDEKDTSTNAGHEIQWTGLRSYLTSSTTFGDVTLIAIKMRATNNISAQASRKINVISTRKLYQWNGLAWTGPTATRSISAALADACKSVGLEDARIDLNGLAELDAIWSARGDHFDARFDSTGTFWECLTKIARAGRAKAFMQGGIVRFMRDQSASLPVAMYTMRNIVRGSFSLEFITPTSDTADCVQLSYFDESTWKTRRLSCALSDSTSEKPAKVELFGVVGREQAYREGVYMAAANRYRRTLIKFTTEMEGFIPSYGDLVAINHDMPQWGQHAEIVAWDAATLTATLSEPMSWGSGSHYVGMRRRDGSMAGPFTVVPGGTDYQIQFLTEPTVTPYLGQTEERTHITFGWGETWRQLARVISIRPKDTYTVELTCVNEDPSVHTADTGITSPAVVSSQLPATPSAPIIRGLTVRSSLMDEAQMLASWQPAPGADYYLIEQSVDGKNWTRCGETRASNFTVISLYGSQTIVRVAGVGSLRGAWTASNFSLASDLMWATDDTTAMWSVDSNLMWRT